MVKECDLATVQSARRCTVSYFAHARPIMFSILLVIIIMCFGVGVGVCMAVCECVWAMYIVVTMLEKIMLALTFKYWIIIKVKFS